MARRYSIRAILEKVVSGKLDIDRAEVLLHRKIESAAHFYGKKVLQDSFDKVFNEALEVLGDEDFYGVRIGSLPSGGIAISCTRNPCNGRSGTDDSSDGD